MQADVAESSGGHHDAVRCVLVGRTELLRGQNARRTSGSNNALQPSLCVCTLTCPGSHVLSMPVHAKSSQFRSSRKDMRDEHL